MPGEYAKLMDEMDAPSTVDYHNDDEYRFVGHDDEGRRKLRVQRTLTLDPPHVRQMIAACDHQVDAILKLYRLAFPDWDSIAEIEGWPCVNDRTWKKLALLFQSFDQLHHPDVLPGGAWMNKGFSTDNELADWTVKVDCVVTLNADEDEPWWTDPALPGDLPDDEPDDEPYVTSATDGNY